MLEGRKPKTKYLVIVNNFKTETIKLTLTLHSSKLVLTIISHLPTCLFQWRIMNYVIYVIIQYSLIKVRFLKHS